MPEMSVQAVITQIKELQQENETFKFCLSNADDEVQVKKYNHWIEENEKKIYLLLNLKVNNPY